MNEQKLIYETPVTGVIEIKMEGRLLENSIQASRSSYGTAQTDEWE